MLLMDRAFPRSRWLARDRYLDRDQGEPFEVEQPAAAALAVRREAFLGVGGFDERFVPAWFEDVDLCARLRRVGPILYWPASRFVHRGGAAAAALGYDQFLPIYYRNAIRFWRKHHGVWAALAYRALVCMGMVLRVLAVPLGARVPASRRQAVIAYSRVLRGAAGLGGPAR
jgi:GT2 family glycosyltransferase